MLTFSIYWQYMLWLRYKPQSISSPTFKMNWKWRAMPTGDNFVTKKKNLSKLFEIRSVAQSCLTLCNPMNRSTPGLPVHHPPPEFTQTHVHWVGDTIQTSHPLSTPSPPDLNLSQHQDLFKWVSSLHEVAKVLEFQLHISPSSEHSGLICFGMDWLDLLAVQGTLTSLLQHHSSKASILWRSAFFSL